MCNSALGVPKVRVIRMLGQGEEVGPDFGLLGGDGWVWEAAPRPSLYGLVVGLGGVGDM